MTALEIYESYLRSKAKPCLIWRGARIGGYGFTREMKKRKILFVHRLEWERFHGPIPEGGWICHHCDNPSCIEPMHLYLGDRKSNAKDRGQRGRSAEPRGVARVTHCSKGHKYAPEDNRGKFGRMLQVCRICRRETQRKRRAIARARSLIRGERNDFQVNCPSWSGSAHIL